MTPGTHKDKLTGESKPFPCGKCPSCTARRVSGWSFRLLQEDKVSDSSLFVTLTYDQTHAIRSNRGFLSLDIRHLQLFFKRLRKANPGNTRIRYFAVGEYGSNTERPHYHVILFNADAKTIDKAWGLGSTHFGYVSGASVGYTLKYINKAGKVPKHANDDRLPEFALMSKGLGKSYLTREMLAWHNDPRARNQRMYCNLPGGKKIAMPRYYKNKIYPDVVTVNDCGTTIVESTRRSVGIEARQAMLLERDKNWDTPGYFREKAESDMAAFRKMAKQKVDGSKL